METLLLSLSIVVALLISIPTLNLLARNTSSPRLIFILRCIAALIAILFCSAFGVIASIILRIAGYAGLSQHVTGRAFEIAIRLATGITFSINDPTNALKTRPAVFVGNHQSELDIAMLGAVFPPYTSVTSKASLKYYPFLGWFMLLSRTVFIDRRDKRGAKAAFDGAGEEAVTDHMTDGSRGWLCIRLLERGVCEALDHMRIYALIVTVDWHAVGARFDDLPRS